MTAMNLTPEPQPRQRRYSVRYQARLDAELHGKLANLAKTLRRKRGQILRHVMQWGIPRSGGWIVEQSIPASSHQVPMLLEPTLGQQVQAAAAAHGTSVAAWVRQAMREVTLEDFPKSWRAGEKTSRSHDSGYYGTRFMLRLDEETSRTLATLTQTFHCSAAEVIRQLIAQARPVDFPKSWHLAVEERRQREARTGEGG
jgi:predicted HicB family RNase H-like nuclease